MKKPKKDICLPVLPDRPSGHHGPRPSRSGRWRAISLLCVHIFMLAHALQWLASGRTITPIEPSESMSTLASGRINAGFIFFGAAILLTLILGRWVCGWGCHLVAYQDLTNWLLKKLRLRPKAFRSRLLFFVPLAAAIYMFILPSAYRAIVGDPHPAFSAHLSTTGFWDTFPRYGIAALTVLVCGVSIIYLLGPKGFCTFACPYGAFFGLADKLAMGRIRVTDACRQCGHCTAVCTSNVKVAKEVHLYKMVVDPGCMKCLDCVSVCPNDALYFGLGLPSLRAKPIAPRRATRFDLTWTEELAGALTFVAAFLSYRGLYAKIPFLLSLGIAGVVTYLILKAAKLLYARDVLIQRTRLKAANTIRPLGAVYLVAITALIAMTTGAGYWRYHDFMGNLAFESSPPEIFGWQYESGTPKTMAPRRSDTMKSGIAHLEKARQFSLIPVPENDRELTWLYLQTGQPDRAAEALRRVLHSEPDNMNAWAHLAKIETLRGDLPSARKFYLHALAIEKSRREEWTRKLGHDEPMPDSADLFAEWGLFLAHCGESDTAAKTLQWVANYDRTSSTAWLALGLFQKKMNEIDASRGSLIHAVKVSPERTESRQALLDLCKQPQSFPAAIEQYGAALRDQPAHAVFHFNRAYAFTVLSRYDEAVADYRAALDLQPAFHEARANLGAVYMAKGDLPSAAREYEQLLETQPSSTEAAMRLGYIYLASGRAADGQRLLQQVIATGDRDQRRAAESLLRQLASDH